MSNLLRINSETRENKYYGSQQESSTSNFADDNVMHISLAARVPGFLDSNAGFSAKLRTAKNNVKF